MRTLRNIAIFLAMTLVVTAAAPISATASILSFICIGVNIPLNSCGLSDMPGPTPTPAPTATPIPTATPVPTATPSQAPCPTGGFYATTNYPPACWKPFSSSSVWNQSLASYSPSLTTNSNSITWQSYYGGSTTFFNSFSFGYKDQNNQYQHPIYFGRASDPSYKVTCNASYAICSSFSSMTFHMPSYAVPAHGYATNTDYADHHMAVIDTTTNIELDCWRVYSISSNTINADSCTYENVQTGDGLNGYETHSGFRLSAGIIRSQELVAGVINHPLFLTAPCTSSGTPVYPAIYQNSTDTQCTSNQGPPYGTLFHLKMTAAQINALNVAASHKAILMTLAFYGGYIADTNGNYGFQLQTEADPMYTAAGYTNANCPTTSPASGIPCTPLTAWEHSMGDPDWNGSRYVIDISKDVNYASLGEWLNAPPH